MKIRFNIVIQFKERPTASANIAWTVDTLLQPCNEPSSIRKYILYRSHAYACSARSLRASGWAVEHPYQIFLARMSADRGWNIKGAEGGAARTRMASPSRGASFTVLREQ